MSDEYIVDSIADEPVNIEIEGHSDYTAEISADDAHEVELCATDEPVDVETENDADYAVEFHSDTEGSGGYDDGPIKRELANKTVKTRIDFDGTNFKIGDRVLNFKELHDIHLVQTDFAFVVYGDRAYLLSYVQDDTGAMREMRWESSIATDTVVKTSGIYAKSTDGINIASVTVRDINSETQGNKVSTITDATKDSTSYYPSNKAVVDYVAKKQDIIEGKNLFDGTQEGGQYTSNTWSVNNSRLTTGYMEILPNQDYTVSIPSSSDLCLINYNYFDASKTWLGNRSTNGDDAITGLRTKTINISNANTRYIRVTFRSFNNPDSSIASYSLTDEKVQFEKGSTATTYEPYADGVYGITAGGGVQKIEMSGGSIPTITIDATRITGLDPLTYQTNEDEQAIIESTPNRIIIDANAIGMASSTLNFIYETEDFIVYQYSFFGTMSITVQTLGYVKETKQIEVGGFDQENFVYEQFFNSSFIMDYFNYLVDERIDTKLGVIENGSY